MKLYIGENLKKLRAEKNVTQDTLAEYLGVTYQAVSRWENGLAYPDIELLPELARFFEVSLEELMGTESDEEKKRNTVYECWDLLSEDKNTEALAKLRELEKAYPNDWYVKMEICSALVAANQDSYDDILPELRKYAFAAREEMKDYWVLKYIAQSMIRAVPEEEVGEWTEYLRQSPYTSAHRALYNRYLARNQLDKAKEQQSKILLENIEYLTHFSNQTGTADGNIEPSALGIRLIDALVGTPYIENGKVHNSILLDRRIRLQTWLACGYAGCGKTEKGMNELEKAVDLCLLWCDAAKDDMLTSDHDYLEAQKKDEDENNTADWLIDALTAPHGWEWFDPIRSDPRFTQQLNRLLAKKAELEEYWKTHN